MRRTKYVRQDPSGLPSRLVWGLLAAFLVAALVTAYLTFIFVRSVVASFGSSPSQAVALPEAPVSEEVPLDPRDLNVPLQQAAGPDPKAWDGSERVNILLMGLDYRDWEYDEGPSRTDTLMLVSVDPDSRTAAMLSIPRDLWVNIPGYDYGKINTAYFLGEAYQEPGGGPGLAILTVEELLDIDIHFYAQVDFSAFESFINEIGGIEVEVPEVIEVDPIGPGNTVVLQPGVHQLDGPVALAYARSRYTIGNDFDRARRQQQVLMAVRDRILSLDILKTLIQKSPILYRQLASGVHTNMTLQQVISLSWTASQIEVENIRREVVDLERVVEDYSWDGQQILRPIPEEILLLKDEIFTVTGPALPAAPTVVVNPEEMRAAENASVAVYNGTYTAGLAARTREFLIAQDVNVTETGNAQEYYDYTTIIDYSGKIYTQAYLVELLNIQPSQVFSRYDPNSEVDISILVGEDWNSNNSMP
jgi:polyisoprenyl-teichoic acid--peptidoglycan teichoic acid transferase